MKRGETYTVGAQNESELRDVTSAPTPKTPNPPRENMMSREEWADYDTRRWGMSAWHGRCRHF
jgi:hypothetical protein